MGAIGEVNTNREFLKKTFDFLDTPNDMYQGSLTVEKRNDCQYEVEFKRCQLLLSRHRQKSVRPCQSEIPYRGKISDRRGERFWKINVYQAFVPSLRSDRRRDPVKWNQH